MRLYLKSRLHNPIDALWDARLGVQTFGYTPDVGQFSDPNWRCHYAPTKYRELFRMFHRVGLGPEDTFVDLGSGLGRAVFGAVHLGARAIGVEIDGVLHAGAEENRARCRLPRERIAFNQGSAGDFDPKGCTVLFIYNAFGRGTLQLVLDRLGEDLERHPRDLRFVYFNPTLDPVVTASGFLRCFDHWTEPPHRHPASFWRAA